MLTFTNSIISSAIDDYISQYMMLARIPKDLAASKKDLLIDTPGAKRAFLAELWEALTYAQSIREPIREVSRELSLEDPTPIATLPPPPKDDMSRPAVMSMKLARKSTSDVKSSPKSSSVTKQSIEKFASPKVSKKSWHEEMMIKWANERKVKSKGTSGQQYPVTSGQQYPVTSVLSEEVLLINSRFFELQSKINEINEIENTYFLPYVDEWLEWFIEGQESMCKEIMSWWNASISRDILGEERTVLDELTYVSPTRRELSRVGSGLKSKAPEMRVSLAKEKEVVEVVSSATEDVTTGDAPIMKVKEEDPAVDAMERAPDVKPSSRNQWHSMRPALLTSFKTHRVTFNLIKERIGVCKSTKAQEPNFEESRNDAENEVAGSGFIDAIVEVLETKDVVRRGGTVPLSRVVGDAGSKHSEMSVSLAKMSKMATEEVSSGAEGTPKQESPIVKAKKAVPPNKRFTFDDDAYSGSSTVRLMPTKVWSGSAEAKERAKDMILETYILCKKRDFTNKVHLEEVANIEGMLSPLTLEGIEETHDIRWNFTEWLQKFIAVDGSICCNASTANADGDVNYEYPQKIYAVL